MEKKIPIYFDSVIVSSPLQEISEANPNIGRLKVRVFTKYGNRNGSYITDEVAEQLIRSATSGQTPVIGFFDPETKTWASHTGPTLANGYGYVEDFLGWEPFTDTDGITREYAVFSVILFTKYFEEAKNILGQNQSMELDPASITGDWAMIEDEEYYVYTTAQMLGFCVIGSHEPCFSVSSFFSKNDDIYKSQYEKFSSLLSDLKAQVEETEQNTKGGEQPMNEFKNQEELTPEIENNIASPEVQEPDTFQAKTVEPEQQGENSATNMSGEKPENPAESKFAETESVAEPTEYELLQQQYAELQTAHEQLQNDYAAAQTRIIELEEAQFNFSAQIDTLRTENTELQNSLSSYQAQAVAVENHRKDELVEKYEKIISDAEKISAIKGSIKDFSYDELESKLAIIFANQQMAGSEHEEKVPLPEPAESQFALLMKNYRKN